MGANGGCNFIVDPLTISRCGQKMQFVYSNGCGCGDAIGFNRFGMPREVCLVVERYPSGVEKVKIATGRDGKERSPLKQYDLLRRTWRLQIVSSKYSYISSVKLDVGIPRIQVEFSRYHFFFIYLA